MRSLAIAWGRKGFMKDLIYLVGLVLVVFMMVYLLQQFIPAG